MMAFRVKSVFGLGEDGVGVGLEGFLVDLLATVAGEVDHERVRLGQTHHSALIW